jgi:uncharacterized delta-60 repeat protein
VGVLACPAVARADVLAPYSTRFSALEDARDQFAAMDIAAASKDVGPENVLVNRDAPGEFLVAGSGAMRLRDAGGNRLDPVPEFEQRSSSAGAVLVPAGAGDYGVVELPASGSAASLRLGASMFSSVGVVLFGRKAGRVDTFEGGAVARAVLPGTDAIYFVGGGSVVEEWLIADPKRAPLAFNYVLQLPPGATLVSESAGGIESLRVVDAAGRPLLRITAPGAVDESGRAFGVKLAKTGAASFSLSVLAKPSQISGSLAIDPLFFREDEQQIALDPDFANRYQVNLCGEPHDVYEHDYDTDEKHDENSQCGPNAWPGLVATGTSSSDKFSFTSDASEGVVLSMRDGRSFVPGFDSASVSVVAPTEAPLVASNFRGGRYPFAPDRDHGFVNFNNDLNDEVTCEISYDSNVPRSKVRYSDPGSNLMWAGKPDGHNRWARFPIKKSNGDLVGYTAAPARPEPYSHMRGYFEFKNPSDANMSNQAKYVTMSIKPGRSFTTADSSHRCAMDALWSVVFRDGRDPKISPPNLHNVDVHKWYDKSYIRLFNDDPAEPDNQQARFLRTYRSEDHGSGLRDVALYIDNDNSNTDTAYVDTTYRDEDQICGEPIGSEDDPGNQIEADPPDLTSKSPCPEYPEGYDSTDPVKRLRFDDGDKLIRTVDITPGRHKVQFRARDFSMRTSWTTVAPVAPKSPEQSTAGWYWVDDALPVCGVSAAQSGDYSSTLSVTISDYHDPGHQPNDSPQTGSGVQSIELRVYNADDPNDPGTVVPMPLRDDGSVILAQRDGAKNVTTSLFDVRPYISEATIHAVVRLVVRDYTVPEAKAGTCDTLVLDIRQKPKKVNLTLVRGASGVAVKWTADVPSMHYLPQSFAWRCRNFTAGTPFGQSTPVPYSSTTSVYTTPICPGAPGDVIEFEVGATNEVGTSTTSAQETVDRRPTSSIGGGLNAGSVLYYTFNGQVPTSPNLQVGVADQDGTLFAAHAPDQDLMPGVQQSQDAHARLVIQGEDPNAANPSPDESFRVIVVLDGSATPLLAVDEQAWSGDPFTLNVSGVAGARTCSLGSGVATGTNWNVDCGATTITYQDTNGDTVVDSAMITLGLRPHADTHDQLYQMTAKIRDERQYADNMYLSGVSGAANEPYASAGSSDLPDVVTDRLVPTFEHSSTGEQSSIQDFHTEPTGKIVTSFSGVDPTPSATTTPDHTDATGLANVTYAVDFSDDGVTWTSDTAKTGYSNCSPGLPAPPTAPVSCQLTVTPANLSPCHEEYRVTYEATDVAGNHADDGDVLSGCVTPPAVTVVRGASGVVGKWNPVGNGESYFWQCTSSTGADIAHSTITADGSTVYMTDLCPGMPGDVINVTVTAISDLFAATSGPASETVDQRPDVAIGDGKTSGNNLYLASDIHSPYPTPDIVVDVSDPDGNLFDASAPDPDILPGVQGGDHARLVIKLQDPLADNPSPDPNQSVTLVVELAPSGSPVRVTLDPGGDAFTSSLTSDPTTTCTIGGDNAVAHVSAWDFDCGASKVVYSGQASCKYTTTTYADSGARLCLALRALRGPQAPQTTTDDQLYETTAQLRDQRQPIDDMYLTSVSGLPDADTANAGTTDLRDVVTDRLRPTYNSQTSMSEGDSATSTVTMNLFDAQDLHPGPGATLPAYVNPTGLIEVAYVIRGKDTTAGVWQPVTPNIAFDDNAPIDPFLNNLPSFGSGCTPFAMPRTDPDLVMGFDDSVDCTTSYQLTGACDLLYDVSVREFDKALNFSGYDQVLTGCIEAPDLQLVRGAGGVAAKWSGVFNDATYDWTCSGPSGQIATGTITANSAAYNPNIDETTFAYHTPLCKESPGAEVSFTVVAHSMLFTNSVTKSETVDRRPSIAIGTDSDGGTDPRYDTLNGQLDANDRWNPDGALYSNGSRNRDVVVDVSDLDGNIREASAPDADLADLVDTDGNPVRPDPLVPAGDQARVVITLGDIHGDANSPDAGVYVIVQLAEQDGDVVVALDQSPTEANPFTRVLTAAESCHPGPNGATIATPQWKLDCSKFTLQDIDTNTLRLRIPVWPRETDSTPTYNTPDQDYPVTGHVRDQRQPADDRYLSAITGSANSEKQVELDNKTELDTIVTDRVKPQFNTATIVGQATTNPGSIKLTVNANDPKRATPPGLFATGVKEVVYRVQYQDASNPPATWHFDSDGDVGCSATPNTTFQTTCTKTVSVANANRLRYRVQMQVVDFAGNHAEITKILSGSIDTPTVTAVRGATGVAATWPAVDGADHYTWSCAGSGSPQGGTVQPSGNTSEHTPICTATPGTNLTITVQAWSDLYSSGIGGDDETVDKRPVVSNGTDPSGVPPYYDSLNGTVYDNGTTNRDIYLDVTDPDGTLRQASIPDPVLQPAAAAGDHARILVLMSDSVGTPNESVRFIVQLAAANADVVVAMQEFPFNSDHWAGINDALTAANGYQTCNPGAATTLNTTHWSLDCTRIQITDITDGLTLRLPAHPNSTTADEKFDLSAVARDQRQPADNQFLYNVAQSQWADGALAVNDVTLDRHIPIGTMTATPASSPAGSLHVTSTIHDPEPGSPETGGTDPTIHNATGIESVRIQIEYESSPNTWTIDGPSSAATCSPASTTDDSQMTCDDTITPTHTGASRYRVTMTAKDTASNHTEFQQIVTVTTCTPGDIDTSWGASGFAFDGGTGTTPTESYDAYVDPTNGSITWSGKFSVVSPTTVPVGRFTSTGQPDVTFAGDGTAAITVTDGTTTLTNPVATGIAATTDGAIVIAGQGTDSGTTRAFAARLTTAGTLDPTFGTAGVRILPDSQGEYTANEVAVDSSNRIVIPGRRIVSGQREFTLTRLLSNGAFDTTFGTAGQASIVPPGTFLSDAQDVEIQSDGRLVAMGSGFYNGTFTDIVVARFNTNGTLDTTFGTSGITRININLGSVEDVSLAGALQPDGKIVLGGYTQASSNDYHFGAARLLPTGALDTTFDGDGKAETAIQAYEPQTTASSSQRAFDTIVDPTGTITLAGQATRSTNGSRAIAIVRYTQTGALDTSFSGNGVAITTPPGSPPSVVARGLVHLNNGDLAIVGVYQNNTNTDKGVTIAYCS